MSGDNRSSRRAPEAAKVEEYDEEEDAVKAGTAVHAHAGRSRASSQAPRPKTSERKQTQPEPLSDSGYASRGTAAGAANMVTKVVTSSTKKPVIHRHDSAQGRSTDPKPCKESCDHPGCRAMRNPERRYTLTREQRPAQPYHVQPPPTQQPYYPPQPSQQYAYPVQMPSGPGYQPGLVAGPRQRALSSTGQQRPSSYHAGYTVNPTYASQYGPPPSPSAYHPMAGYYQQPSYHPQPQPSNYLASTPPTQSLMTYPVQSPITPTSPAVAGGAPLMSARAPINPDLPGLVHRPPLTHGPLVRRPSARQQPTLHTLPGRYIEDESTEESIYSESESEYTSGEDHLVASTQRMSLTRTESARRARDDRERMPPPLSRRPSASQRHATAPAGVPRVPSSREQFRPRAERSRRSATDLDLYTADQFVPDRTINAVPSGRPGRTNSTYSGQSRRPSLSTSATASSDQTPATSYSSGSNPRRIVEDRYGRQREYLSRDDRVRYDQRQKEMLRTKIEEDRARDRLYKQRDTTAKVEEYQRRAAAGVLADNYEELSAEKINQATAKQLRRTSGSHISHHSRKSSSSNKTGAVKISSGGTEVHVYGDTNVTVEANEDGNGTRLIIGNRETSYHGSSRDSKHGRSRGGSDIHTQPIREERDGYESGY